MTDSVPVAAFGVTPEDQGPFRIYTEKPLIKFLTAGVQPPSQVYVRQTDVLQVGCASSQAGESVTFNYRLLRADGSLIKGQFIIQVPGTRAIVTQQEPMAEGFLLSVSCKAAVATTRGQTFVRVFLTSGALGPGQPSYMLMADYVTTAMAPAHPNGRVLTPAEGPGNSTTLLANPVAAGAEWQVIVPANTRWKIRAFVANLTTSAAVANRYPTVFATGPAGAVSSGGADKFQAASTIGLYGGNPSTPNVSPLATVGFINIPTDLFLLAGFTFGSLTFALQGADQWSNVRLAIEEWLDNV